MNQTAATVKHVNKRELQRDWMKNIMVDDDRKFLYCPVAKSGSSSMKRLLLETSGRISLERIQNMTQRLIGKK